MRDAHAVAYFAVTLVRGPSWDESRGIREQRGWDEHAAFMDAEDPWAGTGLLEVGSIQPWALWLDFREAGPAPAPPDHAPP